MTYKNIKCGKSVTFGRYVSEFRDKVLRIQIPTRSVEPSIVFAPKRGIIYQKRAFVILMFMRFKFCQFFLLS